MASLEICHLTDPGGRNTNEDRVLATSIGELYLLAVADGIGGCAAGEVASSVALREVEEFLRANLGEGVNRNIVRESIVRANKEVYLLSRENPEYTGMGTTIVLALVSEDRTVVANVGDSRAYLVSQDQAQRITTDHSVVQTLLARGLITDEQARYHPDRAVLTRALGVDPEVEIDAHDVEIPTGHILLLCSDGLTDTLTDEEIREIIVWPITLKEACRGLIARAKEKGAGDNITAVLAREK